MNSISTRLSLFASLWLLAGCTTTGQGPSWGAHTPLWPGSERITQAAVAAARDPHTWVPLAAAGVLAIGDSEQRISDWAQRKAPLFGSPGKALNASDSLRLAGEYLMWGSAMATPSEGDWLDWLSAKSKGVVAMSGAVALNTNLTGTLKRTTRRYRPTGAEPPDSFPSQHASSSFVYAGLTRHNSAATPMPAPVRTGIDVLATSFAIGTAWARVEGGVHYPNDVLVGAAIGNWCAHFVERAWLDSPLRLGVAPQAGGGLVAQLGYAY